MYPEELKKYTIILASKSPRRQYLLRELDLNFKVEVNPEMEEVYPETLTKTEIPVYLAGMKADAWSGTLGEKEILLTADTIVWLDGQMLGKPRDRGDAISILKKLSGNMHEVVTGVCLRSTGKTRTFIAISEVWFRHLDDEEIAYYVDNYKPYDKAGAYGVQEWIGYVAIEKIHGSYFNVMGLPLQKLYLELIDFISQI